MSRGVAGGKPAGPENEAVVMLIVKAIISQPSCIGRSRVASQSAQFN